MEVRKQGTAVSLDMTLPDVSSPSGSINWRPLLKNSLPLVDIFVPSIEELLFMLEPGQFDSIERQADGSDMIDAVPDELYPMLAEATLNMGAEAVLIKAAHRGAYLCTRGSELWGYVKGCPGGCWIDAFPVDRERFCNASGAGDCAIAGFLSALLKGADAVRAAKYAMLAGRDNLYGPDALSGLQSWSRMTEITEDQV
jgi:sugar/nucleoside kinase (ribokinase family)